MLNNTQIVNFTNNVIGEFGNYDDEVLTDIEFTMPQLSPSTVLNVLDIENDIFIYPNPAKSFLNINNVANSKIELYDIYGNMLSFENIKTNSTQLNTEHLTNGTYFIKVYTDDKVVTRKFTILK